MKKIAITFHNGCIESNMKEITVEIRGGVVINVSGIPRDVKVKIVDYDCDGRGFDLPKHKGRPAAIGYWGKP